MIPAFASFLPLFPFFLILEIKLACGTINKEIGDFDEFDDDDDDDGWSFCF